MNQNYDIFFEIKSCICQTIVCPCCIICIIGIFYENNRRFNFNNPINQINPINPIIIEVISYPQINSSNILFISEEEFNIIGCVAMAYPIGQEDKYLFMKNIIYDIIYKIDL